MGKLIVVLSEKGNVGKSNIACALGFAFGSLEKKTLLIDTAPYRELSFMLDTGEDSIFSFCDVINKRSDVSDAVVHLDNFDLLPSGGEKVRFDITLSDTLTDLCGQYDYVIMDMPSGGGFVEEAYILPPFTAVLPVDLNKSGVAAASIDGSVLLDTENADSFIVINRFSKLNLSLLGHSLDWVMDAVSLPLLGIFPALSISDCGKNPFKHPAFKAAALRIAKRIEGLDVPLPKLNRL